MVDPGSPSLLESIGIFLAGIIKLGSPLGMLLSQLEPVVAVMEKMHALMAPTATGTLAVATGANANPGVTAANTTHPPINIQIPLSVGGEKMEKLIIDVVDREVRTSLVS